MQLAGMFMLRRCMVISLRKIWFSMISKKRAASQTWDPPKPRHLVAFSEESSPLYSYDIHWYPIIWLGRRTWMVLPGLCSQLPQGLLWARWAYHWRFGKFRLHFCQLTLMRCLAYYNMLHVFACADLLKEIPARSVRKTVKSVMVSSCVHTSVCKPHLCKFSPLSWTYSKLNKKKGSVFEVAKQLQ